MTTENWVAAQLSDLVRVTSGIGFPKKYQGKQNGLYPVYKVSDVSNAVRNNNGKADSAGHYVDQYEADELKGEIFEEGVTLFAKIGEAIKLNRRAFVIKPGLADNNVMAVIPSITESCRFIYHFMNTIDLSEASRSTTVPSIRKSDIETLTLAVPSLAEQKEIANRLDTLLAQVEATQASLARIPEILKRFRQSVLAAAVSGKLTEEWRTKNDSTPWLDGVLGDFINKPTYGSSAKSQKEGLVPVLRMGNLQNGKLDWADLVYTTDSIEIEKYNLEYGDVLFNRTNSPELVGKTSIYRGERAAIYAGYLIKISCLPALNPEFLNYHLNSPSARAYCYAVKSDGVSQSNINAKKLAAYPISLPAPAEQTEIVRRVEQIFAYADSIEQQTKAALEKVNNLTQSILAKAFRGELTADWRAANPDLISGKNSAEALLACIKDERKGLKKNSREKR
ncbi:restriction endonuclease subunit S [Aeromonas rivipollensis]|uniref:Restriction endonuclease subunit S n=1 Tax=Aeromonas rivipollensis TaxID=948519 RepID=A0ABX0D3H8_9GAMM|nr:restriction endonuclease subunit S [Aeromonas rivipollensis]NEX90628.1 restriction endonuclease subunit S [Aeromonas rivipollensis]NEY07721.1 restriction endonuclease subunit S [Aeromonas rivipollensis]